MPALPHPLDALSTTLNALHRRQNLPKNAYQPGLIIGIAAGCFFGLLLLVLIGLLICCGPGVFRLSPARSQSPDLEGSVVSRSTEGGLGGMHWMHSFRQIFTMSAHPPPSSAGSSISSHSRRRRRRDKPRARVRYVRPEMSGPEIDTKIVNLSGAPGPSAKGVRVQGKGKTTKTTRTVRIPGGTNVVEATPDGEFVLDAQHPDELDSMVGQRVVDADPSEDGVGLQEALHPDERSSRGGRSRVENVPKAAGWGIFGGR